MTKKLSKDQKQMWVVLQCDIQTVEFGEFRKLYEDFWLTKERQLLMIENMESDHILNCIAMLERVDQQHTKAYEGLLREIYRRTNIKLEGWKYDED